MKDNINNKILINVTFRTSIHLSTHIILRLFHENFIYTAFACYN